MSTENSLFTGRLKDRAVLRVVGKGRSNQSAAVNRFIDGVVEQGVKEVVVDLQSCDWLDSTFVGSLVGLAMRLRKENTGQVALVHVDGETRRQLEVFGLTGLFALEESGEDYVWASSPLPEEEQSSTALARSIVQAHQNLMTANEENAARFAALVRRLMEELRAQEQRNSNC